MKEKEQSPSFLFRRPFTGGVNIQTKHRDNQVMIYRSDFITVGNFSLLRVRNLYARVFLFAFAAITEQRSGYVVVWLRKKNQVTKNASLFVTI